MSAADQLRAALQHVIDNSEDADGWTVGQFVVVMGLERIGYDGGVEATAWYWQPPGQPDWMTGGLLESAIDMRASCELDD